MTSGKALTSGSSAFEEGASSQENASVYDFLYHDTRRVASFLSQFEEHGALQSTKAGEMAGRTGSNKTGMQGGLDIPLVAKGGGSAESSTTDEERETSERTYDPLWRNARVLLDFLNERSLIKRDISSAQIGQFVLVSGRLLLLDLAMLKTAWEKPPIKAMMKAAMTGAETPPAGNRHERRAASAKKAGETQNDLFEAIVALITMLPHALQAILVSEHSKIWSTLGEQSIVGLASDLILKHGALIDGQWYMLGVLDALPYDPDARLEDGSEFTELLAELAETTVGQMAARLAPVARQTLGRPPSAFGMTPLLIFRDVSGEAE